MVPEAEEHRVEDLPEEALPFLVASRYCESDLLSGEAWALFGDLEPGWSRVQAVCDYVHAHIAFGYGYAHVDRTAADAFASRRGVCRDYAHLFVAFCRALNIPTRYCTGYLSFIGEPEPHAPGDFAAWTEVYLGGAWHVFDPRNNAPRRGRILVARGRDAADVPLTHTFGAEPAHEVPGLGGGRGGAARRGLTAGLAPTRGRSELARRGGTRFPSGGLGFAGRPRLATRSSLSCAGKRDRCGGTSASLDQLIRAPL